MIIYYVIIDWNLPQLLGVRDFDNLILSVYTARTRTDPDSERTSFRIGTKGIRERTHARTRGVANLIRETCSFAAGQPSLIPDRLHYAAFLGNRLRH